MKELRMVWKAKKRILAGVLAFALSISGITVPIPVYGSSVWPQKSTAPFYCLDGGKSWRAADHYEMYKYDTLPSRLTEVQARRLFWAYPSNWNVLKEAAKKYDKELYAEIASTGSGPNVVKEVKDDPNTTFAWVADHPEIEERAIWALEQLAAESSVIGKEIPGAISNATSEENAINITVPAFQDGPSSLYTELFLGSEFVADIAKIEIHSVWDNGSDGGTVGWVDGSQEKNLVKSVFGDTLYEVTWSGDSIKIQNNGPAIANEATIGGKISDEEKKNKTTVRYKIIMRENSGWDTNAQWNEDYLHEWMDFKACVNAPGHQRLYMADIRIAPSNPEFYFVISQGDAVNEVHNPEYGIEAAEVPFQIFRHEELFESTYRVKMKKMDDETNMPLKGSQFYLYERFDSGECIGDNEEDGALHGSNLSFQEWTGFQIFAEGITDDNGEIAHMDKRNYLYSKTYCNGHVLPKWSDKDSDENSEEDGSETEGDEEDEEKNSDQRKDANREAAKEWLNLVETCRERKESSKGTHFHWMIDENYYEMVQNIAETGEVESESEYSVEIRNVDAGVAFEESGCKEDCEKTYDNFMNLQFSYTWKEVQARNGYILHGIHNEDQPIEIISTNASEAGAISTRVEGSSSDIKENIWYTGNNESGRQIYQTEKEGFQKKEIFLKAVGMQVLAEEKSYDFGEDEDIISITCFDVATGSNAIDTAANSMKTNKEEVLDIATNANARTASNAEVNHKLSYELKEMEDDDWEESTEVENNFAYLDHAVPDGIDHLDKGDSWRFSYADVFGEGRDFWIIKNHRTEGEIHMNKRDMDLYVGETDLYSAYGETEGDGTLEGALYGLFAAEDILHPDSDFQADGSLSNTGVVYKKHDLVSVAETDKEGNAHFATYNVAPGQRYDYESQKLVRREDIDWNGPANRYEENMEIHGNWWIGRPLILGNYYVKELSRSEGYELSINGKTMEWTNYGTEFDTPEEIADSRGTAVVSRKECSVSMGGDDEGGTGYDELPFSITSTGTTDAAGGSTGYQVVLNGFPEGTLFYRVDSGETEVTGPRITGTEEVIMRDDLGNVIWETAESSSSHIMYEPTYDEYGAVVGQMPMMSKEYQQLYVEQVPEIKRMENLSWSADRQDDFWSKSVSDVNLDTGGDAFCILKAELEEFLYQNGYNVPTTADRKRSEVESPVYNVGVLEGETDVYGLTTGKRNAAIKTVYGEAIREVWIDRIDRKTTIYELMASLIDWYNENSQWSFGGIHELEMHEDRCKVVLYAGMSNKTSRRFFTTKSQNGALSVDCVYAVYENPKELRWVYQKYKEEGDSQYQIERQYFCGEGNEKRYYIDAVLVPAMMADTEGELKPIVHQRMLYHKKGEEVIDYLAGDPANSYKVPKKYMQNKIEITTEREVVEQDVPLETVVYDKESGTFFIHVDSNGTDSFGKEYSDEHGSLELSFLARLPERTALISTEDLEALGSANTQGYKVGDKIGYAEYLIRFQGATIHVAAGDGNGLEDTYVVAKALTYRGQHKVHEDGDSKKVPVQILERPIKQKVKVVKEIKDEEAIGNFRFKIYLKSNLERLFCEENGEITWLDIFGKPIDIDTYKAIFPELVPKIYTKASIRPVLERMKIEDKNSNGEATVTESYNYEKFFDAIHVANVDKWDAAGQDVMNTSSKPFAVNRITNVWNRINSSEYAVENAKKSDAVRQFAVTWYLENYVNILTKPSANTNGVQAKKEVVKYADEIFDEALYRAISDAEDYLKVFFKYDLDAIYSIPWDSEAYGGIDEDMTTLSADQLNYKNGKAEHAYGISSYLPYGDYILTEQQPYRAEWGDLVNRQYKTDTPKEISLPDFYNEQEERIPSSLVPWSITEPGEKEEMSGYASPILVNRRYGVTLRVEKYDLETGEPILHKGAVFALYKAERNDGVNGDGCVKRYEQETMISGSKPFLQAMGALKIAPYGRIESTSGADGNAVGVGVLYSGRVPAGTPICKEEDCILFTDVKGKQIGQFAALSTVKDCESIDTLQTTGYFETPENVDAGAYVLAELLAPDGYARMKPVPVEVYSDAIVYYPAGETDKTEALRYGDWMVEEGMVKDIDEEYARIFVQNTATALSVSKMKTLDTTRRMKLSGRVEGSISALNMIYGLENLELAYNGSGTYLGYGWKKGTLEYLEHRKDAGERIEIVYEDGVFQGYGYVMKTLETSKEDNPYVTGATLALLEAIELQSGGDSEDFAWKGLEVTRDSNGNVTSIVVKEGYAGERLELQKTEHGIWALTSVTREDTPVLFYDLSNLKVLEYAENGDLYGYNREGQKIQVTFDTTSIFAIRDGVAEFEITGGDFWNLVYDKKEKVFTQLDDSIDIYHLDKDLCRDALVDGYTGLAYVEGTKRSERGLKTIFVWPVVEIRDTNGKILNREKILTGRPGEKLEGTEYAYTTGTVNESGSDFQKQMDPIYNRHGLVQHYPDSGGNYEKGEALYDRDGEYISYRYEDLLALFNTAAYSILDSPELYHIGNPEDKDDDICLQYRQGEAWIIPNIWISGQKTPQDPLDNQMTMGKDDILRRVIPGTYIMEEINSPEGYTKALPVAVEMEEMEKLQRVSMTDERIKIEIAKVGGTDTYKKQVISYDENENVSYSIEGKSSYSGAMMEGVKLALYKAKRIYTTDYTSYPQGYFLEKEEDTPVCWYVNESKDTEPVRKEAVWITGDVPQYFEGIPAGDYILEELYVPAGFIPRSVEITIENTSDLQSFLIHNDHIKLEVFKYEKDEAGIRKPLTWPEQAELALYPARTDSEGNVLIENGHFLYENTAVVQWKTGGQLDYAEEMMRAYENMFKAYKYQFQIFSWETSYDGVARSMSAQLSDQQMTENGETVIQIWKMEDGTFWRVTVNSNDGRGKRDSKGYIQPVFEYQFNYNKEILPDGVEIVSYDFSNGIHRLDYIPQGTYILVETNVPGGYEEMAPKVVRVNCIEAIQRVSVENREKPIEKPKGTLIIEKRGNEEDGVCLAGAWFLVKNLQSGTVHHVVTDKNGQAIISDLSVEGVYESGITGPVIYEVREWIPPQGYCLNPLVWQVRFSAENPDGLTERLIVENRQTEIGITKSHFNTEMFVPGAQMAIYCTELRNGKFIPFGPPLEQWVSEEQIHIVKGKLSAGQTYLLVEEAAPYGYTKADPIRFTISEDGSKIVEIATDLMQIHVRYEEDTKIIKNISVTGHAARKRRMSFGMDNEAFVDCYAIGEDIYWKNVLNNTKVEAEDYEDKLFYVREFIEFADGSQKVIGTEYFRMEQDSAFKPKSEGVYPVGTEYMLKNSDGILLERWLVNDGIKTHQVVNEKNSDGDYLLEVGQMYSLEERIVYENGDRILSERMSFKIDQDGKVTEINMSNQETNVHVTKIDSVTGRELSGSALAIRDEGGSLMEQWDSRSTVHRMRGICKSGEEYILEEVRPTDGYAYAKEIKFKMDEGCGTVSLFMEDMPTHVEIKKTDVATGEEIPGAELILKDEEGVVVDQWISSHTPHVIKGTLIAGKTYTLIETIAPKGYEIAEEITFTVSRFGNIDRVIMEDRKKQPQEAIEDVPEIPKVKRGGIITAEYKAGIGVYDRLNLKLPKYGKITVNPLTGEEPAPFHFAIVAVLALAGCFILLRQGGGNEKEGK